MHLMSQRLLRRTGGLRPYLEWGINSLMVYVKDEKHHSLQRIGGQEPMLSSQQPALIVAPRFDLLEHKAYKLILKRISDMEL